MAELLGSLLVRLGLESGAFKSGLDSSTKEFQKAQKSFEKISKSMGDIGKKMTLGVTLPLTAALAKSVAGAQEQAAAMGQVESALASMGAVSGKTAGELAKTADALEMRSLFAADEILTKVTANLLTFGNVANEQFDRAQQAAIDMATRMGNDPQSAAIMLGKALNDPIKGITALTKVGVQFTAAQKASIKALADTGQTAKAQGIILTEVERQFKGAAQAAADTKPWRQAQVAVDQAMDKIGEAILPILPVISDAVKTASEAFANMSPEMQKVAIIGIAVAAALGPLLTAIGAIVTLAAPLAAAFTTAAAAAAASGVAAGGASAGFAALAVAAAPWIAAAAAIGAAGYLIYENWDKIAPVLMKVWEAISATLGPPVQAIISTLTTMFSELWSGPFGEGVREAGARLAAFGAAVLKILGPALVVALKLTLMTIANVLGALLELGRGLGSLLNGDVGGALSHFAKMIDNLFGGLPGKVIGWIGDMVSGIGNWMGARLNAIWDSVKGKIDAVKGWFYGLYDAVVGHSYVPDMVDEIGLHMRRLDAEMVEPVKKATGKAGEAFRALQQEVAGILARLFPGNAAQLAFEKELSTLNTYFDTLIKRGKDALTVEQERLAAVTALRREYSGWSDHVDEEAKKPIEVTPGTTSIEDVSAEISDRMGVALGKVGKQADEMRVKVIESFGEMVNGAMRELDRFVNGIKSGNWLDIIGGLLSAIEKVGGIISGNSNWNIGSLFGGKEVAGARAQGGPVMSGRPYLVGERGPEIFSPRTSGAIIPNDRIGGGGDTFHFSGNLLTPEWWAQIQAGDFNAANAGSASAQSAMARGADRRLA
jgi:hypothetical protein